MTQNSIMFDHIKESTIEWISVDDFRNDNDTSVATKSVEPIPTPETHD